MDVTAERAGLHLMDELREIEADGRYRVKVRVHAPQATMKTVDKAALLEAGATRVELIPDEELSPEAASSSLLKSSTAIASARLTRSSAAKSRLTRWNLDWNIYQKSKDHVEISKHKSRKSVCFPPTGLYTSSGGDNPDFRRQPGQ
ncbi:MAG: hypothetical protein ACLTZY_14070 [Alistipes indistinctus]